MKIVKIKKLMISGISTITNNEAEFSEDKPKIANLWEDYFKDDVYVKTFNKAKDAYMYGAYSHYESDSSSNYKITVGIEVTKPKNALVIEDQRYLMFSKKGELPNTVVDLWEEIWAYFEENSEYERVFKIDFEKYVAEDEVEIYISIK